ncbi:MAG: stage V sporulation protein AC [Oscillospiraceae bacterium]|nr:stage V sporulation protein AC [Oscillospiraceae bacterium]
MNETAKSYDRMVKKASPGTKSGKTIPSAFCIGGLICLLGQALINIYEHYGAASEQAHIYTLLTLIFISSLLTGFGVYNNIAKYAGAGTLVPITGFANAIAAPAIEFKTEGFIIGIGTKMFAVAGPVIVYGISASILYGIVIYVFGLH